MEHNGYANYETWTVVNAFANIKSLYNFGRDMVEESRQLTKTKEECKLHIMKLLRSTIVSMQPNTNNHIWAPIINDVVQSKINFSEIADSLMEEYEW